MRNGRFPDVHQRPVFRSGFAGLFSSGDDTSQMNPVCRHLRFLTAGLVVILLQACSSAPRTLLDSDVPAPADMENRLTDDIKRRGGQLISAHAVYAGMVIDADTTLNGIIARFLDAGWSVQRNSGDEIFAVGVFMKNDRRCRVRVLKNELSPSMSQSSYLVSVEKVTPDSPGASAGG